MDYDSSQLNLYASKRPKFFLVLAILLYFVAGMLSIAQDKNFDNPLGARFVLLQGKIKAFYCYVSGLTASINLLYVVFFILFVMIMYAYFRLGGKSKGIVTGGVSSFSAGRIVFFVLLFILYTLPG